MLYKSDIIIIIIIIIIVITIIIIIIIIIIKIINWYDLLHFNNQPSFTVKNPRLQLVKIDHVISVYLLL